MTSAPARHEFVSSENYRVIIGADQLSGVSLLAFERRLHNDEYSASSSGLWGMAGGTSEADELSRAAQPDAIIKHAIATLDLVTHIESPRPD